MGLTTLLNQLLEEVQEFLSPGEVKEKADCSDYKKDASHVTWLLDPYYTCREDAGINFVVFLPNLI